jgi:hypothetical protein
MREIHEAVADLEINIQNWDDEGYAVEMSLRDRRFRRQDEVVTAHDYIQIEFDDLNRAMQADDYEKYGKCLTVSLLAPRLESVFTRALNLTRDKDLRVRLSIGSSAPELNQLNWETLRDPAKRDWLLMNPRVIFSRYNSGQDYRPLQLRPAGQLNVLLVIADPAQDDQSPSPEGAMRESEKALRSLGTVRTTVLSRIAAGAGGEGQPVVHATLNNMMSALRGGQYDVLYLVGRWERSRGGPKLYMEDKEGRVDKVEINDLVGRLGGLSRRPGLIILAMQEDAESTFDTHTHNRKMLISVGMRIAGRAGIPAVLTMQENVEEAARTGFLKVFFEELQKHGEADRAVAVGRQAIRRSVADRWKPAIFTRLTSGLIWYYPGFEDINDSVDPWDVLIATIGNGDCTPILGPSLLEPLAGTQRELARRWAELHHLPVSRLCQKDLPQVAQDLVVMQGEPFVRALLSNELKKAIIERHSMCCLPDGSDALQLDALIRRVGQEHRRNDPAEPHKVLASLPIPVYVTTNPDNLLFEALEESTYVDEDGRVNRKQPKQEFCRWRCSGNINWPKSHMDDTGWEATVGQPLVYHLFGGIKVQNSVVLTEDNFFDYLNGITREEKSLPTQVRHRLSDSALLILGFNLDEWSFRVLLRSIMGQQGTRRLSNYTHFAVQIDPEDAHVVDPDRARQYLENQISGIKLSIYWGGIEDFINTLHEKWNAVYEQRVVA